MIDTASADARLADAAAGAASGRHRGGVVVPRHGAGDRVPAGLLLGSQQRRGAVEPALSLRRGCDVAGEDLRAVQRGDALERTADAARREDVARPSAPGWAITSAARSRTSAWRASSTSPTIVRSSDAPGTVCFVDTTQCFHFGSRVESGTAPRLVTMIQYLTPSSFMLPRDHRHGSPFRHLATLRWDACSEWSSAPNDMDFTF